MYNDLMAKKLPRLGISLNLLKPQSNPEKIFVRFFRWLLSTGRYIFIIVEALVLIAFVARFKLDADLASKKEAIEQQLPYIESLKESEVLIRQTQLKLSTIGAFKSTTPDYTSILKKIAEQTPLGVTITNLNVEKGVGRVSINLNAQSQNNNEVNNFIAGLKEEASFSDVSLTNVALEQGGLRFSVSLSAQSGGRKL